MKILGIDTSTSCGSVGLVDDQRVIADTLLNLPVTHSERLLAAIGLVLDQSRLNLKKDVNGIAISLGPGSFTGLRIGVSAVKGLAFATGLPVVGVSTLDTLAAQVAPTSYAICPILDARKAEVYTALYRYERGSRVKRLTPYQAIRPEELVAQIREKTILIGDGVKTYADYFRNALPSLVLFPAPPLSVPHGSVVATLGLELLQRGEILDLPLFTPIYVRPSEAEIKWQETHSV
jgi:tRNA threonylcarbamoyladenosine biosynthesis protein TsaB